MLILHKYKDLPLAMMWHQTILAMMWHDKIWHDVTHDKTWHNVTHDKTWHDVTLDKTWHNVTHDKTWRNVTLDKTWHNVTHYAQCIEEAIFLVQLAQKFCNQQRTNCCLLVHYRSQTVILEPNKISLPQQLLKVTRYQKHAYTLGNSEVS